MSMLESIKNGLVGMLVSPSDVKRRKKRKKKKLRKDKQQDGKVSSMLNRNVDSARDLMLNMDDN